MSEVSVIPGSGAMTPEAVRALCDLDRAICEAVAKCMEEGTMRGLIVSMLQVHIHSMLNEMAGAV